MTLPFEGLKVIDMTRVLAGPYCTMLLKQMGARVIKIERPGSGDDSRSFGPFIKGDKSKSAYFTSINWGKESITLNLKKEEGKRILKKLVKDADILVENFRPGTMEKLGLGWDELEKINPKLIYAASSGYGHSGPYSKRAAYDMIIQGMSGIMSITGIPDGPPVRVGASVADITAGMFTAYGISVALYERKTTNRGQKVDVAMLDSVISILENALVRYETSGNVPGPIGTRHPSITPFQAFPTTNGHVIVAVGNDKLWAQFCTALEMTELIKNPKYVTNEMRNLNQPEIEKMLCEIFSHKSTEEWLELLEKNGIPAARINNMKDLFSDPQVAARKMLIPVDDDDKVSVAGNPIKMSNHDTPESRPAAPKLGQNCLDVLKEAGFSDDEIKAFKADGVI